MNKNLNTNRPSECERFAHCVWHDKRAIIFEQRGDARFDCRMILSDDDDDDDEIGTVNDDDEIRIVVRRVKQNR